MLKACTKGEKKKENTLKCLTMSFFFKTQACLGKVQKILLGPYAQTYVNSKLQKNTSQRKIANHLKNIKQYYNLLINKPVKHTHTVIQVQNVWTQVHKICNFC